MSKLGPQNDLIISAQWYVALISLLEERYASPHTQDQCYISDWGVFLIARRKHDIHWDTFSVG